MEFKALEQLWFPSGPLAGEWPIGTVRKVDLETAKLLEDDARFEKVVKSVKKGQVE